jgi:hypothetical protein
MQLRQLPPRLARATPVQMRTPIAALAQALMTVLAPASWVTLATPLLLAAALVGAAIQSELAADTALSWAFMHCTSTMTLLAILLCHARLCTPQAR